MKASELIQELEKIIKEHGDLPVYSDLDWTYMPLSEVEVLPKEKGFESWKQDGVILR